MTEPDQAFYSIVQKSNNPILVKDDVGKPKKCIRKLPPVDHAYGLAPKQDVEGAGAVITSWFDHQPTKYTSTDRDFRKLNRLSIAQQCITPKQVREFRKQSDIRMKPRRFIQSVSPISADLRYGIPTKPPTPMHYVMSNAYGNMAANEKSEEYVNSYKQRRHRSPQPINRNTNQRNSRASQIEDNKKQEFKLKKFSKVEPKVKKYIEWEHS